MLSGKSEINFDQNDKVFTSQQTKYLIEEFNQSQQKLNELQIEEKKVQTLVNNLQYQIDTVGPKLDKSIDDQIAQLTASLEAELNKLIE